ncbi:MAG: PhoH family protein [Pseudomonadota bacterium]
MFGSHNENLRHLEDLLTIDVASRGNTLLIKGEKRNATMAQDILDYLYQKAREGRDVTIDEIESSYRFLTSESKGKNGKKTKKEKEMPLDEKAGIKTYKNKLISPRSPNQANYIEAIRNHDMVFGIGPAGTGKTFLAVAAAVQMYQEGKIERMVFCRPAVEAGEQLGFLPGDMLEKIDPYLRPIYDALHDMMPAAEIPKKIESGDIEIAPLAFMRGRTLKNAFVVLDEAQNTTSMQMKMFLTRMGEGTRMVITGDPSQIDLPHHTVSGLKEAMSVLENVDEVPFIHFDAKDVVRHKLVTKIIEAYDKKDSENKNG